MCTPTLQSRPYALLIQYPPYRLFPEIEGNQIPLFSNNTSFVSNSRFVIGRFVCMHQSGFVEVALLEGTAAVSVCMHACVCVRACPCATELYNTIVNCSLVIQLFIYPPIRIEQSVRINIRNTSKCSHYIGN